MRLSLVKTGCCIAGFLCIGLSAGAEQYAFTGARAVGMAGANAASVTDTSAQWHNPAAFGFMNQETNAADNNGLSEKHFGWDMLGVGAGYTMTKDMGRYLDIIGDIDFDDFNSGTLGSDPENVSSLLKLGGALYGINENGNALYADFTAGSSFRFGHFGLGIRIFGEAAAWVQELDTVNLGLDQADAAALVSDINNAAASESFNSATYNYGILTPEQQTALLADLNNDANAVKYLDFKLSQLAADGTLSQADIDNAVKLLETVDINGSGTLSSNLTSVVGRGFSVIEIPLSYGRAINDNLSLGITAKGMYGSVRGTKVWVFNENNVDDVVENVQDSYEDTLTFGLDLGALYRISNFQFALVGHNLNSPVFNGFTDTVTIKDAGGNILSTNAITVPDVTIDPQVTLGAAFIPFKRLTLEADFDLLETGTLLNGYDIQRLSFGGELDFGLAALRLGAYRNIAASWEDWVATAGLGANIFGVRLDVAGAYSLGENAEYDGEEIPTVARLYASLSFDY